MADAEAHLATKVEVQKVERKLAQCKRDVEEDILAHNAQLKTLCEAVARIEAHTKKTAEIVEVWDSGKNIVKGIGAVSGFFQRTYKIWLFLAACVWALKTGKWPTEWFK